MGLAKLTNRSYKASPIVALDSIDLFSILDRKIATGSKLRASVFQAEECQERAVDSLVCPEEQIVELNLPERRSAIQDVALANNLIFKP